MAALGSMRSRMSSFTPMGPQPAPEMPELKPATLPTPAMRPMGTSSGARTSPRPPHSRVAKHDDADEHDHRRDEPGDELGRQGRREERPQEGAAHAADDEGDGDRPGDVAHAVVGACAQRDDEHLEEQRCRRREAWIDAEQQQTGYEDAAVDTDRRRSQPGSHGHETGQEDGQPIIGRGHQQRRDDDDDADDWAGPRWPGSGARSCRGCVSACAWGPRHGCPEESAQRGSAAQRPA